MDGALAVWWIFARHGLQRRQRQVYWTTRRKQCLYWYQHNEQLIWRCLEKRTRKGNVSIEERRRGVNCSRKKKFNSPLWTREAAHPAHSTKKGYSPISASFPPTMRERSFLRPPVDCCPYVCLWWSFSSISACIRGVLRVAIRSTEEMIFMVEPVESRLCPTIPKIVFTRWMWDFVIWHD